MSDIDRQENLVRWAYVIQWATLVVLPAIVLSLAYLLLVRNRVTHGELRSHLNWQLMTNAVIFALIPVALAMVAIVSISGVSVDGPLVVISTYLLLGAFSLWLPGLVYRLIRGSIRFSRQEPMNSLFP